MPAATFEVARPIRPRDMIFSFDTTSEPTPSLSDTPRRTVARTPGRADSGSSHRRPSVSTTSSTTSGHDRATNGSRSPNQSSNAQDGVTFYLT